MPNTPKSLTLIASLCCAWCTSASAQVLQSSPATPIDPPSGPYGQRAALYQYDDGTRELNYGYGAGNLNGEALVMHRFQVIPGAEDITQVMAVFGAGVDGLPVKLCIWEDPNDNGLPDDAVLIGQATINITNSGTNTFNVAQISTTQRPRGSFFVGYVYPLIQGENYQIISTDTTTPYVVGRSFTGISVGPMNINNLTGLAYGPIDWASAGGTGSVMIRATGIDTGVTYQGELKEAGLPASGPVDLIFKLFNDEVGGVQRGPNYLFSNVTLDDGRFTVILPSEEFAVDGSTNWLQIEVSPQGVNTYTTLSPRQLVTPTPSAIHARVAARASAVDWDDIENKPTLANGDITSVVAGPGLTGGATTGDATLSVAFAGTGTANTAARSDHTQPWTSLTGVPAGFADGIDNTVTFAGNGIAATASRSDHTHFANEIINGTLPDSVLSPNVALLNTAQAFTGAKTFTANTVIGSPTTPESPLHIHESSAGAVTANTASTLVLERASSNFLSILSPDVFDRGILFGSPAANVHGSIIYTNSAGMIFRTGSNFTRMTIDASGRIGIGRNSTINTLEVEGNASKSSAGLWLANSDGRIKTNILNINNALTTLNKVRLVSFDYSPAYLASHPGLENRRYLNVIAQEFAQVFPDHVKSSGERLPDGSEILQVDTYPLTIYSAAAIQELDAKLKRMETTMTAMRGQIETLEEKNRKLQEQVSNLQRLVPGAK